LILLAPLHDLRVAGGLGFQFTSFHCLRGAGRFTTPAHSNSAINWRTLRGISVSV
jgi:hypothetical protein